MRGVQNQNLPLSTLFIYSRYEEEGLDIEPDVNVDTATLGKTKTSGKDGPTVDASKIDSVIVAPIKRRMFFLVVHDVIPEESSTILKITQDSTVNDVIAQALSRANKSNEKVNDYVLLEEVNKGWKKAGDRNSVTQRILEPNERPLEAQNNWKGEGKLILKKLEDDPSTRAWMTTIRSASANKERSESAENRIINDWQDKRDDEEIFLVCIYNVSKDQPYTILKASIPSTALDIISQALHKAHRNEDPKLFVLIEEIESFIDCSQNESRSKNNFTYRRVVADLENIYDVQTRWKYKGKFELKYRSELTTNDNTVVNSNHYDGKHHHFASARYSIQSTRGSLKKLSRIHRTNSKRLVSKENESATSGSANGSGNNSLVSSTQNPKASSFQNAEKPIISNLINEINRQVHSDGELSSDWDEKSTDTNNSSSLNRLKKLSIRRLKAWKT